VKEVGAEAMVEGHAGMQDLTLNPRTACMRKLLTILNAMVKSGTLWRVVASQPA
jgi:hypothetical protein